MQFKLKCTQFLFQEAIFLSDRKRTRDFPDIFSYWIGDLAFIGIYNPEDAEVSEHTHAGPRVLN